MMNAWQIVSAVSSSSEFSDLNNAQTRFLQMTSFIWYEQVVSLMSHNGASHFTLHSLYSIEKCCACFSWWQRSCFYLLLVKLCAGGGWWNTWLSTGWCLLFACVCVFSRCVFVSLLRYVAGTTWTTASTTAGLFTNPMRPTWSTAEVMKTRSCQMFQCVWV